MHVTHRLLVMNPINTILSIVVLIAIASSVYGAFPQQRIVSVGLAVIPVALGAVLGA